MKNHKYKLLATLLVLSICMLTFLWVVFTKSAAETVIDRIRAKGGAVQTRTVFPLWADKFIPGYVGKNFHRPYAVWLPADFGDMELNEILKIEGLTSITASGTAITEKSLSHLADYKGLELLYLNNCNLSPSKLQWLEKQLPATSIIY